MLPLCIVQGDESEFKSNFDNKHIYKIQVRFTDSKIKDLYKNLKDVYKMLALFIIYREESEFKSYFDNKHICIIQVRVTDSKILKNSFYIKKIFCRYLRNIGIIQGKVETEYNLINHT